MTTKSFRRSFKLLRRWGYQCIVCGRPFANLACVTVEHIVPRCVNGNRNKHLNTAPSHWRCNQLKGNLPLMVAAKAVDQMEKKLGPKQFHGWLNARLPGREVPWYALVPIVDAEWFII
jgi:5-methylcytosine-specific restriction endonuclease McrA